MPFRQLPGTVRTARRFALLLPLLLPASLAGQGRSTGTYARGPMRRVLADSTLRVQLGEELGAAGIVAWRGDSIMGLGDTGGPRACRTGGTGTYAVAARGDSLRFTAITGRPHRGYP